MYILVLSFCEFIKKYARACVNLSLPKINQNDTHIVTSFTFGPINIRRQQGVQKTFGDLAELDFALHLDVNVVDNLLTGFRLPNAVAAHDGEICFTRDLVYLDVR